MKLLLVWILVITAPDAGTYGSQSVSVYLSRNKCEQEAERAYSSFAAAGTTRVYAYCEPTLLRK